MGNTYLLNALRKLWNLKGSVIVWGMTSSTEIGPIVRFHGNINASVYKELLALPQLRKGTVETPIFMQDNAPCYKAKTVLSFLEKKGIGIMNHQENGWKIIREKAQDRNPQNIDDLWGFLKEEWESITTFLCKKLINSCGRSCNELI